MKAIPYLSFEGVCEQAIEFYKTALGAKVEMMMRFKDAPPECKTNPESANKIMHAAVRVGDTTLFLSDGQCREGSKFEGIALAIDPATDADAQRLFGALAAGGNITMPLARTFFSSQFGIVKDRFGVSWMVMVPQ